MDIKVITRHAPSNYGSLLQSFATLKILEEMGHEVKLINYIRKDERGIKAIIAALKNKPGWNNSFFKKVLYILLRYPEEKLAELRFDKMRRKYLYMTERISTHDELANLNADIFITGSDQVWGKTINGSYDSAYFLEHVKKGKKVAYAASFGRTDFSENTLAVYQKMLSKYDAITVRENSAVNILKSINVECYGQVLDPTLLFNGDEWSKLINNNIEEKYVLVYQLHNNPILNDYAINFSKKVNLPLFRISPNFHQFKRGGKFIYLPELDEFLSYIKNSTYFITDSFHGTAFAINFNRQFIEILPNNKTASRNQSILQLTGLQDRIITDYNDFSIANKLINYNKVNAILSKEREKSKKILSDLIYKNTTVP